MRTRTLNLIVASGSAVCFFIACGNPASEEDEIKKTTQASSVVVGMVDRSGKDLGTCSGTLVSPNMVLTAGHCAAGASRWNISGSAGVSTASRAVTPWRTTDKSRSQPNQADVALLVLDRAIKLDRYPLIAKSALSEGTQAVRFHRSSGSAAVGSSAVDVADGDAKGFRLAYTAKVPAGEFVDTGGALIDPKTGKIHGVVSSVGKTSGLLYVARTDNFSNWIRAGQDCSGGESSDDDGAGGGSSVGLRSWGDGGYGGTPSGGGSSSGGYGGGSSGGGGYGGGGKKPGGGLDGGSTVPGSSGDGGGGSSDGDGGGGGGSESTVPPTCPPTPTCTGSDCPTGGGGSNSGGNPGSRPGGGNGGGGGGGAVDNENCEGPEDNPELCPPSGGSSGGGGGCAGYPDCVDELMDYGDSASPPSSGGSSGSSIIN